MTFGASLKRLRMERGLSQEELARRLGTSKQAISRYENGARVPKISTVSALAAALDAPLTALTGEEEVFSVPGVERPRWQRVPLLGDIACGEPILAEENLEGYVEVDASVRCDFTLRCRGDSMEPRLHDGDIVMIRIQPDVLDGQIAAVLILPVFLDVDGIWGAVILAEALAGVLSAVCFVYNRKKYNY